MLQTIRQSAASKVVAGYLSIQLTLSILSPTQLFALTQGPEQPEFQSFTPIGASDMVDLASGDFQYNIPLMDVGGYPLNLSYQSGISMDQEASWVGLGWNLNVGQINRQMRGLPDEFKGDLVKYNNNLRDNKTVGMGFNINTAAFGIGDASAVQLGRGLTVLHNNYTGISFERSYGLNFSLGRLVQAGMNVSTSAENGVSLNPNIGIQRRQQFLKTTAEQGIGLNFGVGYNSRQGLTNFNMSAGFNMATRLFEKGRNMSFGLNGGGSMSFLNRSFTPSSRNRFKNSNVSAAFTLGPEVWGVHVEGGITIIGSTQSLVNKEEAVPAYGYNNTGLASPTDLLDFNREKEAVISKNTLALSPAVYTYDLFNISGQGIGGMFRPFHSQVGQLYTPFVADESGSDSFGLEIEGGAGGHIGTDFTITNAASTTGPWDTGVNRLFDEVFPGAGSGLPANYENTYYKLIGETTVDLDDEVFNGTLGATDPIRIKLSGGTFGKVPLNAFELKNGVATSTGEVSYTDQEFTEAVTRTQRELRSTAVTPVFNSDVNVLNQEKLFMVDRPDKPEHHLAGFKVVKPDGARYNYGQSLYNNLKAEVSFAVRSNSGDIDDYGLVSYTDTENSLNNNVFPDNYYNRVETPAYSHTYLLTSVLSADYEDISQDGPSDDDLGAYTLFDYQFPETDYEWRVPFQQQMASFNQGLNSDTQDQRASYIYGKKELAYLRTIETKTHLAVFTISPRHDNKGVASEDGGIGSSASYFLEKISLYSLPEVEAVGRDGDGLPLAYVEPIKEVHFVYDYSLCQGVPNNDGGLLANDKILDNQGGKLTLKSLYFTYRDSNKGSHSPYHFNYDGSNPDYHIKGYDIWGNFKPEQADGYAVSSLLSNMEYPYVNQSDRALQDQYASAWLMTSIDLPSGGRLEIDYEADDYAYVQNKKAMGMFKIHGFTSPGIDLSTMNFESMSNPALVSNELYTSGGVLGGGNDSRYVVIEIPEKSSFSTEQFFDSYLGGQTDRPIYFRTMLNMTKDAFLDESSSQDFDYVTGYFNLNDLSETPIQLFQQDQDPDPAVEDMITYVLLPMAFSDLEGNDNGNEDINPISKAGWYFARKYLRRQAFGFEIYTDDGMSMEDIARELEDELEALREILMGQNSILRNTQQIARKAVLEKSWLRLQLNQPKIGGGARVKEIRMLDNWKDMLGKSDPVYDMTYGQQYSYVLEDGSSSGVATYEPNMSKENPFVVPFYNKPERLIAPQEVNYVEEPFGESFFPSARVTYARVEVKNLPRTREVASTTEVIKKHATGKVVTEFFTSKDFPTRVDYTSLNSPDNWESNDHQILEQTFAQLLGASIDVRSELTLSQGFVVLTNDMNGRQHKQKVYNEYGDYISGVTYVYQTDPETGLLDNAVPVINPQGEVEIKNVGMHYDVINDFKEHYSQTEVNSFQANVDWIPPSPLPLVIPMGLPRTSSNTAQMQAVTTTKVIHQSGILVEKIAEDLGAKVSTKNLAWDATTGQVLLTETVNEYDDNYYNTNFPAYWIHERMGLASTNLGMRGSLIPVPGNDRYVLENYSGQEVNYFSLGDEIVNSSVRYWVSAVDASGVQLMDVDGFIHNACGEITTPIPFVVYRSGNQNMQSASMASITAQVNPYDLDGNGTLDNLDINALTFNEGDPNNPRIVNASAVTYSDFWVGQSEDNIPPYPNEESGLLDSNHMPIAGTKLVTGSELNPFLYNIKGQWRANESYAFLTGRGFHDSALLAPRNEGFFDSFTPFYTYDAVGSEWTPSGLTDSPWQSASTVTSYSPYGSELENEDALNRFSSAQYGYDFTLPVAVAANSRYSEMGFDGFEDYGGEIIGNEAHFSFATSAEPGTPIEISSARSHSGKSSLKVAANTTVNLQKSWDEDCSIDTEPIDDCAPPLVITYSEFGPCDAYQSQVVISGGVPNATVFYRAVFSAELEAGESVCAAQIEFTSGGSSNTFLWEFGNPLASGMYSATLDSSGNLTIDVDASIVAGIVNTSDATSQVGFDIEILGGDTEIFAGHICRPTGDGGPCL